MEDQRIVALYWSRSEEAITETATKYGSYLHSISYHILANDEDAEECVNDTYTDAWNAMPPHRPTILSTFLGKLTRRISIDRWRGLRAEKRGGGEADLVFEELEDCVSGTDEVEAALEAKEAARLIREFLEQLPTVERRVFLRRYWFMDSVSEIASDFKFTKSKTLSMLHRIRGKLRKKLESEGFL